MSKKTIEIQEQCLKVVQSIPGITSLEVAKHLNMEDDLNCIQWHLFLLRRDGEIRQSYNYPAKYFPTDNLDKEWGLVQPSIRIDP